MLRQAFAFLLGSLALAGCQMEPGLPRPRPYGGAVPLPLAAAPSSLGAGQRVAILLPLSGARADVGQAMLKAAQLALAEPGSPTLDTKDTGGTPDGAAKAAREALAGRAVMILGPLTGTETAAVAPIAQQAGVPVLAFTNDPAQARPGVWTLGITPDQQVRRLVAAAQAQGKPRLAALLPETEFGKAMGAALSQAAAAANLPTPAIRTHAVGTAALNAAMRDLSDYAERRGVNEAEAAAARARGDAESRREAADAQKRPVTPPPFDALLLAETGPVLAEIAPLVTYYDLPRSAVQIMGPALWAAPSSGSSQFDGAWYAAPDPAARAAFAALYASKYGAQPSGIADLAYDAASIARVAPQYGGYSASVLTQPEGYSGADGALSLSPDGQVRRGLALFAVQKGGNQMIEPAPPLAAPGT